MVRRLLRKLDTLPSLMLGLCALFWAGNAVASRLAIGHVSPFALTFLRWLFVIGLLWPIYGAEVRANWSEIWPKRYRVLLMGTLGFTAFNALFYGAAHYTTAINIGIIQGSIPIFVLAGAFLAHGTRATWMQLVGVLITSVGVVVVATRGSPLSLAEMASNFGDLAILLACALYAFFTVALRDRPNMGGAAFFTLLAVIAAVTSLPLLAFEVASGKIVWPTWQGWLLVTWVALFPSCLAQLLFLRGVDLIGPSRAGVFVNLVPVFAAVLAVFVINEPFALYHAIALALVLAGIWLAQQTVEKSAT